MDLQPQDLHQRFVPVISYPKGARTEYPCAESSSRIYSPYVFAIGQLIGELPYSVLCAFVYWVLMVWPMGFGQGAAGNNGNGFQFLIILFMELFGVTLGQFIGAISPNIQVCRAVTGSCGMFLISKTSTDRRPL